MRKIPMILVQNRYTLAERTIEAILRPVMANARDSPYFSLFQQKARSRSGVPVAAAERSEVRLP